MNFKDGDVKSMIEGVVGTICASLVQLPCELRREDVEPTGAGICADVLLSGPRSYRVSLRASAALADLIAAAMLGAGARGAAQSDDAFAEFANMTAGNLRSLLDVDGLALGFPSVSRGSRFPPSENGCVVRFRLAGEPLVVVVAEESGSGRSGVI